MKAIDLTGKTFSRLTVLERAPNCGKKTAWRCLCACGRKSTAITNDLRAGKHRSCGCLQIEAITTHGYSYTPTRSSWSSMIQRCTNPNSAGYHRYGGRGIRVCSGWRKFENFLADMGERPSKKHSLERINNDAGYEPGNARWATQREQAVNRASNRLIRYDNRSQTVIEWVRELELDEELVRSRLKLGWPFDKIVQCARLPQHGGRNRINGRFAPTA